MNGTLVYSPDDNVSFNNLKKNKWHKGYYDISISTMNGTSYGEDYAVLNEVIGDGYMKYKERGLKLKYNKNGNKYLPEGYYYWE